MNSIQCKKCGQCCYAIIDGKPKKCRYLIKIGKKTMCRVYPNRIGTEICMGWNCTHRDMSTYDYAGCPYNDPLGRRAILNIDVENNTLLDSNTKEPGESQPPQVDTKTNGGQDEKI